MSEQSRRSFFSEKLLGGLTGGNLKTNSGMSVDVSSNGTTSLSGSDAVSIAMRHFKEMRKVDEANAHPVNETLKAAG